jgi:hypothetical protein
MSLSEYLAGFFRNEDEEAEGRALALARERLDWAGQAYHAKFEAWLDTEASRPFDAGVSEAQLRAAVMRANCYREILKQIRLWKRDAEAALQQNREETSWQNQTLTE